MRINKQDIEAEKIRMAKFKEARQKERIAAEDFCFALQKISPLYILQKKEGTYEFESLKETVENNKYTIVRGDAKDDKNPLRTIEIKNHYVHNHYSWRSDSKGLEMYWQCKYYKSAKTIHARIEEDIASVQKRKEIEDRAKNNVQLLLEEITERYPEADVKINGDYYGSEKVEALFPNELLVTFSYKHNKNGDGIDVVVHEIEYDELDEDRVIRALSVLPKKNVNNL